MKPWKRDLAYIREVGPDEPRFDAAVQRVWDRCEELEAALRRVEHELDQWVYAGQGVHRVNRAEEIIREALS